MRVTHTHANGTIDAPGVSDVIAFGTDVVLRGVNMRFERNEEIFGEDESADYVYRVASGAVRTMRFTSDGRRQILGFHLPGDIFGLELNGVHSLTAEAVAPSDVILVRCTLIEKAAAEHPVVARTILQLTTQNLMSAREHAMLLARKGASERVAAFLLHFAERCPSNQELDLPMSRADIADFLGLTIESVSRAFAEMERQHAIALPSSRHVIMRSRSALMQLEAA
jgi:CRP/FNR family nitrogen fixation transcriptional regulator